MATKSTAKQAEKKQKQLTRGIIAEKLNQLLENYKSKASAEDVGKVVKKASKLLSKIIIVPLPPSPVAKKKPLKKAALTK